MFGSDLMELLANEKIRELHDTAAARQTARGSQARAGWRHARAVKIRPLRFLRPAR